MASPSVCVSAEFVGSLYNWLLCDPTHTELHNLARTKKTLAGTSGWFYPGILAAFLLCNFSTFANASTEGSKQPPGTSIAADDDSQLEPAILLIKSEDERYLPDRALGFLDSKDAALQKKAIVAAGRIGDTKAIAKLAEILALHPTQGTRELAAFALGEIESAQAVEALLQSMESTEENPVVRARAAEGLGKIVANKKAAETLGKDGSKKIADALARLLVQLHAKQNEAAQIDKDEKLLTKLTLLALLRAKDPSTVASVATMLSSKDPDIRFQTVTVLARWKEGLEPYVAPLTKLLADEDPLVRATAARALGASKDKQSVEKLLPLLDDKDERTVAGAIVALGMLADKAAVDPLVKAGEKLLGRYSSVEYVAGSVPDEQNLLLLIASTLGTLKDERALPFLKSYRKASQPYGRQPELEIAIAQFGDRAFFDEPAADPKDRSKESWQSLSAKAQGLKELKSEQAGKVLVQMLLAKPDSRLLPEILNGLAAVKDEDLKRILLEQLKAKDQVVRATAATLLSETGDKSDDVITGLKLALETSADEKMNDARISVLDAAAKLKRPMSLSVLQGKGRDRDYVVRKHAIELLEETGEKVPEGVSAGRVESGHDLSYWKHIALLANSDTNPRAIIHTKKGDLVIELYAKDAPMTVNNFIELAQHRYFDRLSFMRVVPNFVIQGGDPRNDMNGGPGYSIRCEINQRPYLTGTVGMALSGKDTGGSQFFITHSPQPHLDGGYTVFGQLVEGLDTLKRIARTDKIEQIEIKQANKD